MDQEPRADSTPREGDILAEKYRIEKILGEGGMGVVVAAHHLHLEERVAIKFLLPEATSDPEVLARFSREARAAVKIKSEHVARVADVGVFDNGAPYIVMEYLEGADVATWLAEQGPLSTQQAAEFVLQASEAIAEAHTLGIIHRDLKPANLFVIRGPDGKLSVKVLDFGISKFTGAARSSRDKGLTKTTTTMGTPLYMAPEQLEAARNADVRSDIWSLGVILYELVTDRPPFDGETMPELLNHVLHSAPPPIETYRGALPEGFEAVVLKCLEKAPDRRYQNVGEFAAALSEFAPASARVSVERISNVLEAAGVTPEPSWPRNPSPASAAGKTAFGATAPARTRGGRSSLLAVGVVIAISLIGTVIYLAERTASGSRADTRSAAASAEPGSTTSAKAPQKQVTASTTVVPEVSSAPLVGPAPEPSATALHPKLRVPHASHKTARARTTASPRPARTRKPRTPAPKSTSDVYSDRK